VLYNFRQRKFPGSFRFFFFLILFGEIWKRWKMICFVGYSWGLYCSRAAFWDLNLECRISNTQRQRGPWEPTQQLLSYWRRPWNAFADICSAGSLEASLSALPIYGQWNTANVYTLPSPRNRIHVSTGEPWKPENSVINMLTKNKFWRNVAYITATFFSYDYSTRFGFSTSCENKPSPCANLITDNFSV